MTRPRPCPPGVRRIAVLALGAALIALPGCFSQSEGRPAGSIEVKGARSSSAAEAKAQAPARAR